MHRCPKCNSFCCCSSWDDDEPCCECCGVPADYAPDEEVLCDESRSG